MALPGERGSGFPNAYMTKVPSRVQRREERWADKYGKALLPPKLLGSKPSFNIHDDDLLYFDYGAVRFGRKPQPDDDDDARVVCVGLGWLPDWEFTINSRGLSDIKPADALSSSSESDASDADDADDDKDNKVHKTESGVLGLLYKLVLDDAPRRTCRSLFSKRPKLNVNDISAATMEAWDAAIPFHSNLKVLRRVELYIHVFDGGIGHKYYKDGRIVPFRTPESPINVVVHIDPPRLPRIQGELRVSSGKLQGEWVAKEINRWIKDAKLPSQYVDQSLRELVPGDPKKETIIYEKKDERAGLRKFLGLRQ